MYYLISWNSSVCWLIIQILKKSRANDFQTVVMPYHVKAAVNHMPYCSCAYINHYEIFLGEKCSRVSREPLCPLFKRNKLVILRAWWIICNTSLGDFPLRVNRDCVFPKPPCTWGTEASPAVWDMSVACNRAEGSGGRPSKSCAGVTPSVQRWPWWPCGFGMQGHIPSGHCTLLHRSISSSEVKVAVPDTTVLHRNITLQLDRVSPDLFLFVFLRERESDVWITRGLWQQIL